MVLCRVIFIVMDMLNTHCATIEAEVTRILSLFGVECEALSNIMCNNIEQRTSS